MKYSVDGLVIWETKTGEADRVINILTGKGLITAYSKGSLRPKNKLASSTALLSYSSFELFKGSNMYSVDEAEPLFRFLKLSTDMKAYALVLYFCELLKTLVLNEDDTSEYLSLMLNAMYLIDREDVDLELIKSAFEFKVMQIAGYMPDIFSCDICGKEDAKEGARFDLANGVIICASCARDKGMPLNCNVATLEALRYILNADIKKVFSFRLKGDSLRSLSYLTSRYVENHLEFLPRTLEFYQSL
ncbi:MAG: DNA repair protein RecO [Oscillospiraceae bacterium]|nr:DNA repair protein RecO [Oscillospiraceae bacterium]